MLKITPQSVLQFNPLDDTSDLELLDLPAQWTGGHCALRLCEGFKTLRQLPLKGAALGFKNSYWVAYAYEWQDLIAQAEGEAEALQATQRAQNRVRLQPSLREVTRCEAVIAWSARYLIAHDHLCAAVNMVALAHSLGRDAGWCTRRRGGYAETWRQRHDKGCVIIAAGLSRDCVPVF
jgi:hypothetical protein